MSLRTRTLHLAHARTDLRPHLLPLLTAASPVTMTVSPKFYIERDLKDARRIRYVFAVQGTERQGLDYVNANLTTPLPPALVAHLAERWDRFVHHKEGPSNQGPSDASFLEGALLREAQKAANIVGRRAGAATVELRALTTPTR